MYNNDNNNDNVIIYADDNDDNIGNTMTYDEGNGDNNDDIMIYDYENADNNENNNYRSKFFKFTLTNSEGCPSPARLPRVPGNRLPQTVKMSLTEDLIVCFWCNGLKIKNVSANI